jgi:hypothetical protein
MGSRWCAGCLSALILSGARGAYAEDIGSEPLVPIERPSPAPGGAASGRATTLGGASAARAPTEADLARADAGVTRRHWYGWQTLVVDAIPALGLIGVAANQRSSDTDGIVIALVTTYFLGGPIVHAAHGHVGKALLSVGIRSLGPLLILAGADADNGGNGAGAPLIVLGVLAIPAAIAIDSAAIAREDVTPEDASILNRIAAAPWVDPKTGGAGFTAAISF